MKKFLLFVIVIVGSVWTYFWYVRGVNLLIKPPPSTLPAYSASANVTRDASGAVTRWQVATPMPTPRTGVSAAAIGDRIYVVGGMDTFGQTVATVEVFDTAGGGWTAIAPLPKPVRNAAVSSDGSRLYVFGGVVGIAATPVDSTYIFDPKTDTWSSGTDLPQPIGAAGITYAKDGFYLIGGLSLGRSTQSFNIYEPISKTWQPAESITSGRDHLTAEAIDGKVYAIGGRAGSLVYNMADLEIYDEHSRTWEQGINMPAKRSAAGSAVVGGIIYVFGGEAPSFTYGDVFAYEPRANAWKVVDSMPTPRHSFAIAAVKGRVFVIGGGQRPGLSVSDVVEVFTP